MARRPRHSSSGCVYHVMIRGNNGQIIFSTDYDRNRFCLLMQEGVERFGHRILAYCFMSNHVHLAIQVGETSLSKICQNLCFRYTRFYNLKRDTIGHLFQGRFKSILVIGHNYARRLIRYIHLNPVRAGIVDDPSNYPWSSHQAYLMQKEVTWLSRDEALQFFGESRSEAVKEYYSFVLAGIGKKEDIDFKRGIADGIIGDDIIIDKESRPVDIFSTKKPEISLCKLLSVVAERYRVDQKLFPVLGNDRLASRIRAVTVYLARIMGGISLKEVAAVFARAPSAMSPAATRLEAQIAKSDSLKKEIEEARSALL